MSIWFEKFTMVLSGVSPLKVPAIYFDLEPCFGLLSLMLMLEEFNSGNYMKTLVIKVSKISFSKLRDNEKSYRKLTQYPLHHKCG
jgi:hypothetical protein